MKTLVIVNSTHRKNTLKIAQAMAETSELTIVDVTEVEKISVGDYNIVGYGSGIYAGKFNKKIIKHIESNINDLKHVFIFSTSCTGNAKYNEKLISYLNENCKNVLGSFSCRGAFIGKLAKGHPDETEIDAAKAFIGQVIEKYKSTKN